jgi:hypothetical protein
VDLHNLSPTKDVWTKSHIYPCSATIKPFRILLRCRCSISWKSDHIGIYGPHTLVYYIYPQLSSMFALVWLSCLQYYLQRWARLPNSRIPTYTKRRFKKLETCIITLASTYFQAQADNEFPSQQLKSAAHVVFPVVSNTNIVTGITWYYHTVEWEACRQMHLMHSRNKCILIHALTIARIQISLGASDY